MADAAIASRARSGPPARSGPLARGRTLGDVAPGPERRLLAAALLGEQLPRHGLKRGARVLLNRLALLVSAPRMHLRVHLDRSHRPGPAVHRPFDAMRLRKHVGERGLP